MQNEAPDDPPFSYRETKEGRVFIDWHEQQVMILKGKEAVRFLDKVTGATDAQQQQVMAKQTGNFKRGNERSGKTTVKLNL